MDNRNSLIVLIWNAQSIRNKSYEISNFINTNNNKIIIILISETWLRQRDSFTLPNYTIYRNDRVETRMSNRNNGGGVAIAIRNDIPHTQLPNLNTKIIETIGIEVNGTEYYSIYFPGSRLNPEKLTQFKNDIAKLTSSRKNFFLGGDLNSKHRFWNCSKSNKAGNILYKEMITRNFTIHYPATATHFPPQANRNIPSTIDIAISNGRNFIKNIYTVNALSSNHLPVVFEIECSKTLLTAINTRLCYSKANWSFFRKDLESKIDLTRAGTLNSKSMIDTALVDFERSIIEAESLAVPLQEVRPSTYKLHPQILKLISLRNCLRRQAQRRRCPIVKKQVTLLNRTIAKNVQFIKNDVWQQKLANVPKDSKQLWKFTKIITNKCNMFPPLKNASNQILLTDAEKADEIGKTFNAAHYTTHNCQSDPLTETAVNGSSLIVNFLTPVIEESDLPTPKEIKILINKLKLKKSPGMDKINNLLLKNLPRKAIVFLMYVFRSCIKLSYFPDAWKHAKVIPIPKPGKDLSMSSNYRPISLLSSLSKIFEKILLKRINIHLSAHDILPDEQFGFRQNHSCNHQLTRLTNHIKNSLSEKKSTGLLAFDIEKAFDSVWHKGLVHKMFKLKFPLYITKLIRSFLSKRSFQVSINGTNSKSYNIVAGVPQGSVLSPTLYNIFTSDLIIAHCEKGMFADDTTLQYSSKSPNKILKNLNSGSKELSDYCLKWKIRLNDAKTKAAFFTKRKALRWYPSDEVTVLSSRISWNNDIKTLGLTLDKTLTFNKHIDLTIEKALKCLGALYPLLNRNSKLNVPNKLTVYNAIIRNTLLYACPVWYECAETHLKKLQIIQNKCLKIIYDLPRNYPTLGLHRTINYPTIKEQILKTTQNFNRKLSYSENQLIRCLR